MTQLFIDGNMMILLYPLLTSKLKSSPNFTLHSAQAPPLPEVNSGELAIPKFHKLTNEKVRYNGAIGLQFQNKITH